MTAPEKITHGATIGKFPIVQLPWRKFAGIGVPEDGLRSLLAELSALQACTECSTENQASARELQERIDAALALMLSPPYQHLLQLLVASAPPDHGWAVRPTPIVALAPGPSLFYVFHLDTLASMLEQLNSMLGDAPAEAERASQLIRAWYNVLRRA